MPKKVLTVVCVALLCVTLAFIFYNSLQPVPQSTEASGKVAETLSPIPKEEYETPQAWHAFVGRVRKAAHGAEFFVLGAETAVLVFVLLQKRNPQAIWNVLSFCLAIAVADESLQFLSKRGPQVQDVLLDFVGACVAAVLVFLLAVLGGTLCKHWKNREKKYV